MAVAKDLFGTYTPAFVFVKPHCYCICHHNTIIVELSNIALGFLLHIPMIP